MNAGKSRGRVSADALARRKKVGEFLRRRRLELGLSQGDMIKALGYANRLCGAPHKRFHVTGAVM